MMKNKQPHLTAAQTGFASDQYRQFKTNAYQAVSANKGNTKINSNGGWQMYQQITQRKSEGTICHQGLVALNVRDNFGQNLLTLVLSIIAMLLLSAHAFAQVPPTPDPLPARLQVDGNGVDLVNGSYHASSPGMSIGQSGAGGLGYSRFYSDTGWRDQYIGSITKSGTTYTVNVGQTSEEFELSSSIYTSQRGSGNTLTFNSNDGIYTYTFENGAIALFRLDIGAAQAITVSIPVGVEARLYELQAPNGVITKLNIRDKLIHINPNDPPEEPAILAYYSRLQSVTNNLGYQLHFDYLDDSDTTTVTDWHRLSKVTGINTSIDYCDPVAVSCSGFTKTWPTLTYTYNSAGLITSVKDALNRTTEYSYSSDKLSGVEWPSSSTDNITIAYHTTGDHIGYVSSVNRGFGTWSYAYSDASGVRTTTVTNPGTATQIVKATIATGLISSTEDGIGRITNYVYDSDQRLTDITYPEGNKAEYTYDSRGNVTETRAVAKTGSSLSDIVSSATYPSTCSNQKTCNQPISTTDARGQVTNYYYDSTHGGITSVKAPSVGGVRPETTYSYAQKQARYKSGASTYVNGDLITVQTITRACSSAATCVGNVNETKSTINYPTTSTPNNLLPVSAQTEAGDNTLTTTATFTYDHNSDVLTVDGPLSGSADTVRRYYNAARQIIGTVGVDPDGSGSLKYKASRTTYNTDGLPTMSETGTVTSQSDTAFSSFLRLEKLETIYDTYNRPVEARVYDGSTKKLVSQLSYNTAGRIDCTALRMNPAVFDSLPASACSPGTTGSDGADRISKVTYDNAGQVLKSISAYNTPRAQDTVTQTYTTNGLVSTLTDAKGNRTTYSYDGFDRLIKTQFPSKTTINTSSITDFETTSYHDSGADKTLVDETRRRDGSIYDYSYDTLGRITTLNAPGSEPDTTFTYDFFSRTKTITRNSQTLTYAYDALSRVLSESSSLGVVSYQYDVAGRRTKMTWPDAFYVDYDYDVAGAVTSIRENGATTGAGVLASFAYDDQGRRTSITRGNGVTTSYGFDALSRLTSLTQDLSGTANDQTYGFTYTSASQIASKSETNDTWGWLPEYNAADTYTINGINQFLSVNSVIPTYDDNGNLTGIGSDVYTYDSANRLQTAKSGSNTTVNFAYDPVNRLYETAGSATTRFQYDGTDMITEYNASGTVLRRYVHGPGIDEPLVWYEGSTTTTRKWLVRDTRGSVVGVTDASGDAEEINNYSPYGVPGDNNLGRFQYTGQTYISDDGVNLYYYKARFYSPDIGRFLQTDPIGYGDGMNMYAYAGGDPINGRDPSGLLKQGFSLTNFTTSICYTTSCGRTGTVSAEGEPIEITSSPHARAHTDPTRHVTRPINTIGGGSSDGKINNNTFADLSQDFKLSIAAATTAKPVRTPWGAFFRALTDAVIMAKISSNKFTTIYRVWGGPATEIGGSWTTENPYDMSDWRDRLAVKLEWNSGRYVSIARIRTKDLVVKRIAPQHDKRAGRTLRGGGTELVLGPNINIYIIESGLPFEI